MTDPTTRLEHAIARLGAEHEPPPGWQARVFAAVARRQRVVRIWCAIAAFAAAAAGAALVLRWPRRAALTVTAELVRGPRVMRGDVNEIRAVARGGAGHRAIWVYRNGRELVAICPGHAGCRDDGDALRLELSVERIGTYQVVAVSAASPPALPGGSYDADLAAAIDAGARCERSELELR